MIVYILKIQSKSWQSSVEHLKKKLTLSRESRAYAQKLPHRQLEKVEYLTVGN